VEPRFECDDEINTCVIYFGNDMCEEESTIVLSALANDYQGYDKFIVVIPDPFEVCESFRIQIHRYILAKRKTDPSFRIAVVTTLLKVIGYERFAKTVIGMIEREQIFDTLDEAIEWIKNE